MKRLSEDTFDDPPSGQIHICSACGRSSVWGPGWVWYGSYRQVDDGLPPFKACSDACMALREEIELARASSLRLAQARELLHAAQDRAAALSRRVAILESAAPSSADAGEGG